jgi:hypothetical protein
VIHLRALVRPDGTAVRVEPAEPGDLAAFVLEAARPCALRERYISGRDSLGATCGALDRTVCDDRPRGAMKRTSTDVHLAEADRPSTVRPMYRPYKSHEPAWRSAIRRAFEDGVAGKSSSPSRSSSLCS